MRLDVVDVVKRKTIWAAVRVLGSRWKTKRWMTYSEKVQTSMNPRMNIKGTQIGD